MRFYYLYPFIVFSILSFLSLSTLATIDSRKLDYQQNIELKSYYWVNTDKTLTTIDEVRDSQSWVKTNMHSISDYEGPAWLKFQITNTSHATQELIWLEKYPMIREIEVYIFDQDHLMSTYRVGEKFPFYSRPIPTHTFAIPFTIDSMQTVDLYIRPHVLGNNVINHSSLWEATTFLYHQENTEFWQFFFFGMLFVMSIYSFIIFLMNREKCYLYYSGFIASSLLFYVCNSGYAFQIFWPDKPFFNQRILYIGIAFLFYFAGAFSIAFLNLNTHFKKIAMAINVLILSCLCTLLLYLSQPFDPNFVLVRIMVALSLPVYVLCWLGGILSWIKLNDINAKIYTMAWSILIIVNIIVVYDKIIISLFSFDSIILLQVAHGIEVMILSITLATRISASRIKENLAIAKAETQSRFLAHMSHEIRTPMNGILGVSDILRGRLEDKTNKHYIDVIYTSADMLSKIINNILDYSRVEAGKLNISIASFSLHELLNNIEALFEFESQLKSIDLTLNIKGDTPDTFMGDVNRIRQILINLLSNALKYTPAGSISLNICYQKDHLFFHVKDTGIGILKDDQQRLFQPFEQVHNDKFSSQKSTGLGLAICQELAEAMHGKITVTSQFGKGSCFTLKLPLPIESKQSNPYPAKINTPVQFNYSAILVVEDNPTNSLVVCTILEKLHIPHHICQNGLAGYNYFKAHSNRIDLILMDCEMPVMDGFQATESIRCFEKKANKPKTPIIALTAHTWPQQLEKCYHSGMDDLLLKPITQEQVKQFLLKYNPAEKAIQIHNLDI